MRYLSIPVALAIMIPAAQAQQSAVPEAAPVAAAVTAAAPAPVATRQVTLPANAEFQVAVVESLNSKTAKLGDTFKIATVADVTQDGVVVIPHGTPGEGKVIYRKGSGSFGKSGKLEVEFQSLDLNGQKIAIGGKYREEGKGNGGAAVGAVVAIGIVGGFLVKGHSVAIDPAQNMAAHIVEPLTVTGPTLAAATN